MHTLMKSFWRWHLLPQASASLELVQNSHSTRSSGWGSTSDQSISVMMKEAESRWDLMSSASDLVISAAGMVTFPTYLCEGGHLRMGHEDTAWAGLRSFHAPGQPARGRGGVVLTAGTPRRPSRPWW